MCDDILLTGMACLLVSYFAFVAREKDKDLTADDWKCVKWKWVHTLFTGTHNKATDSRDSAHFLRWKDIYWRLFLYWQQLYRVIPHETSVRLVPGQSWSWRHFWEMNMLMLTRAAQWRPCQTHSHSTRHCVVCVSHKSHSRGYGWLKGRCCTCTQSLLQSPFYFIWLFCFQAITTL